MRALEGIVVIDFTQAYSGPFCTMQLADFGATVIKIERPGLGDQSREWAPFKDGYSGYYASINRNKKGITLDVSKPEGLEVAKKLIAKADVVVENFKVGTMEKMGLSYEEVKAINPSIIYASISGFGQDSPLKDRPAYDNVIQAMTGLQEMTGYPEDPGVRCGPAIGDSLTGLYTAYAILMAYRNKMKTGAGERIDVAMYDVIFSILEPHIMAKTLTDYDNVRGGCNDRETLVPYDVYKCKDGYFSCGLASDNGWLEFCQATDFMNLYEDPRFETNAMRCEQYDVITPMLAEFFIDKTRAELDVIFSEAGIPNAPVLSVPEAMVNEQIVAREMVVTIDDAGVGTYQAQGNPMRMDGTPVVYAHGAPTLGQDNEKIFGELGYSEGELADLAKVGAI
ncbi:CoA transferase [Chakrabartyella piscis]|uniref:CaiB/BaiF CoA transferase family protein n=1 Tax=Chakrabartyella piscis TaxID=2918914 RepID=UPI002958CC57|nr:CoA transferase [Chakrabartyella piscis]